MILCMSLWLGKTYAQKLDQQLSNVDQSSVSSGIIYERSGMYTPIFDYNMTTGLNSADSKIFEQTLNDLYFASNQTKFVSNTAIHQIIDANRYKSNIIEVGIINTTFHVLNYNPDNPSAGGLTYDTNTKKFAQIPGRPPFLPIDLTMASPLKKETTGSSITFMFKNNLIFSNSSKPIKSLYVDFGDGVSRMITGDGLFKPTSITVNYNSTGIKNLKFDFTFMDDTVLTTYGNFFLKYVDGATKAVKGTTSLCNGDTLADDFSIVSDTEFKGYNEPFAFKGKIDYRIFYHTNNNNTQKKLLKPVIIVDGFDPGDKRKILACDYVNYNPDRDHSIQDMMMYPYKENGVTKYRDLIQELRDKGYDVTIVNQPTYCVSTVAPYNVVSCGSVNSREVNGGADFIERNALALATLIKNLNSQLKLNGSSEKLAIVGPSMGGQISRYALANLEKQGIDHNTRLWISVDSPHLGANIPLGDQALIHLLKVEGNSLDAGEMYDNLLGAPAARQQLIEFHRDPITIGDNYDYNANTNNLNGRITAQGFSTNSGNPFYQQYYNNMFTNGLPNSNGYPVNLRKIALTNGSLTGKTQGNNNQLALNIRAFTKVTIPLIFGMTWTFTIHMASLESYFMPSYNTDFQKIAHFKKAFDYHYAYAPNINSRGNMDTVPGGWYPAQNDIANAILGKPVVDGVRGSFWQYTTDNIGYWFANHYGSSYWELRDFQFNHSFIPTFSSLGIKNPDRNWAESLQRNLVCSGETPFDSYYGSSENTQHTSFTEDSVNWLMKELDGQPQAPWFPIAPDALQGTDKICVNQTASYSFADPCKLPSKVIWNVSPNLQIVSSTDYTVNVKSLYQGQGIITATFQNGQTVTKNLHMGGPVSYMGTCNPYDTTCTVRNYVMTAGKKNCITFDAIGMDKSWSDSNNTDFEWEKVDGNFTFVSDGYPSCMEYTNVYNNGTKVIGKTAVVYLNSFGGRPVIIKVRTKNSCEWGPWQNLFFYEPNTIKGDLENADLFTISPNPSNDFIKISPLSTSNKLSSSEVNAELYNAIGIKQRSIKFKDITGSISVKGLLPGVYTLKLIYDSKIESHQIIVKQD